MPAATRSSTAMPRKAPSNDIMIQMIEGTNASVQSLTEVVSRTIEQVQALAVTTQVLATNDTNIKAAVDQHSEALRAQEELRFKLVRENEAAHSALLDKISQLQVLMLQSTSGVKDKVDERSTEAAVRFQNWVAQGGIVALGVLLGYLIGHWRP